MIYKNMCQQLSRASANGTSTPKRTKNSEAEGKKEVRGNIEHGKD